MDIGSEKPIRKSSTAQVPDRRLGGFACMKMVVVQGNDGVLNAMAHTETA